MSVAPANETTQPQLPQTSKSKHPSTFLTQLSKQQDSYHLFMDAKVWKGGKGSTGIQDEKGAPFPYEITLSGAKDGVWGRSLLVKERNGGRITAVIRRFYEPENMENYLYHICGFVPAFPGQEPWHEKATFEGHPLFIWATMYSQRHDSSFCMTLAANPDAIAQQKARQYETTLTGNGKVFAVHERTQPSQNPEDDVAKPAQEAAKPEEEGRVVASARMEGSRLKGGRTWDIKVGSDTDPAVMAVFVMLVEKIQRHRGSDGFFSWANLLGNAGN